MVPLQDELLVSFIVADRLAEAERFRLLHACASCARRAIGRLALLKTGRFLVRLGMHLEGLGSVRSTPRPADVRHGAGI